MDFQDFPKILGSLGVETDHPPKMCAGLAADDRKRCTRSLERLRFPLKYNHTCYNALKYTIKI